MAWLRARVARFFGARAGTRLQPKGWTATKEGHFMRNVIYIIGLIVVVVAVLSLAGIV